MNFQNKSCFYYLSPPPLPGHASSEIKAQVLNSRV